MAAAVVETADRITGGEIEINIHHGKFSRTADERKEGRVDDMDAAKRLLDQSARGPRQLFLSCLNVPPAAESVRIVEEEIPGGAATRDGEGCERPVPEM